VQWSKGKDHPVRDTREAVVLAGAMEVLRLPRWLWTAGKSRRSCVLRLAGSRRPHTAHQPFLLRPHVQCQEPCTSTRKSREIPQDGLASVGSLRSGVRLHAAAHQTPCSPRAQVPTAYSHSRRTQEGDGCLREEGINRLSVRRRCTPVRRDPCH